MNTNTKPFTLFVHGRASVMAVKKGNTLFTFPDMLVELTDKQLQQIFQLYTTESIVTGATIKFFLEHVTKTFVNKLRAEADLRRQIGGTQWMVRLASDFLTMHLQPEDVEKLYKKTTSAALAGRSTDALFDENLENILVAIEKHIATQGIPSNA